MIGEKFWNLTVVKPDTNKGNRKYFLFLCDCGNEKSICIADVKRGHTKSCGCLNNPSLSKEKESGIVKMYTDGAHMKDIISHFNSTNTTIKRVLKENSIPIRAYKKSSHIKEDIGLEYDKGKSMRELALEYDINLATAARLIRKYTKARDASVSKREFKLNEDTFYNLTNDSMYWLGMIASDGNVHKRVLKISLHKNDHEHLCKFRDFMQSNYKIRSYRDMSSIDMTSKRVVDSLLRFGITPNKSLTFVPSDYLSKSPHFWRGMIDGDGSVHVDKRGNLSISLCSGSLECINKFEQWVKSICSTKASVLKIKDTNCFSFSISNSFAVKVANELYGNNPRYALDRKIDKVKPYIYAVHSHI